MATIVTRSGKGSALTHVEMDANFDNLNNDKPDVIGTPATNNVVTWDANDDVQDGGYSFPNCNAAINASDEELNFSVGVTSLLQTQMDEKETYVQSITGTVAASALTVGLGAGSLNFRNATITSGAATENTNIALSLVVPSGATLGATDATEADLVLLAIDNAGTSELAIVNNSGTVDLDEKALISTTAIDVTADSADTVYSTSARTDVAFRVVGLIRSTQATAGTWATAPSLIQGRGGNALISESLGGLAELDSVGQSTIDADSVGQSEVKTSSQEITESIPSASSSTNQFVATGGVYILGHEIKASANKTTESISLSRAKTNVTTSYTATWRLTGSDSADAGGWTAYANLYYINSSPPYDLGFGNIPLFIFAVVDNGTGNIEAVSLSVDAPWHYNGPTDITPSAYGKDGTPYKILRQVEFDLIGQGKTVAQELRGVNRSTTLARLKNDPMVTVEIDQAMKNADMGEIPHPFKGDLVGKTVVVVNPQSTVCEDLLLIHERGESVATLFHDGSITLGTAAMQRGFDPSVKCVDANWT